MTSPVKFEVKDGLATIALAQPERRNALSFELARALDAALDAAAADRTARVALLVAEGPAFCAGMDLRTVALDDPAQADEFARLLAGCYRKLLGLPVPLLAAVDGPAMGGAVGLALAADLVWAGPAARFAFPETRVGVVPALVSVVARRRVLPGRLHGLCIAGVECDPARAVAVGMADFAPEGRAADEAEAFGRKLIREHSAEAMRRTRAFLRTQFETTLGKELDDALAEFRGAVASDACRRGLAAFREKRSPDWATVPLP